MQGCIGKREAEGVRSTAKGYNNRKDNKAENKEGEFLTDIDYKRLLSDLKAVDDHLKDLNHDRMSKRLIRIIALFKILYQDELNKQIKKGE